MPPLYNKDKFMKFLNLFIVSVILCSQFLHTEWKLLDKNQQSDRSNVYMDWSSPQYGAIYQLQTDLSATKTFIKVTSDFGNNWSTYSFDSIMVAKNFSPFDRLIQLEYIGTNIFGTTGNKKIFLSTDRGIT